MLQQWDEVFGRGDGKMASPMVLVSELQEHKKENERLRAELEAARFQASQAERSCLEVLAHHHKAHAEEREREAARHMAQIAQLRELHKTQLKALGDMPGSSLVM